MACVDSNSQDRKTRQLTEAWLCRAQGKGNPGWLICCPEAAAPIVLQELRKRVAQQGGLVIRGAFRPGLLKPFGGLLDAVDALVDEADARQPELLRRTGRSLLTLLPARAGSECFADVRPLRAGLADFVLRDDRRFIHQFFQRRNIAPQMCAHLVQFVLDVARAHFEATGQPLLLCLEEAEKADSMTLEAVRLLHRYAGSQRAPILFCLAIQDSGWPAKFMSDGESGRWEFLECPATEQKPTDVLAALGADLQTIVRFASAFADSFRLADLDEILPRRLGPDLEKAVQELSGLGILTASGSKASFASASWRQAAYRGLPKRSRRELHRRLMGSAERADPFALAWHARRSGLPSVDQAPFLRSAMEAAWAASAYECAIPFALRFAATAENDLDRELLMGFLFYEAMRYEEADPHFVAALEAFDSQKNLRPEQASAKHRTLLEYLVAYNAVFGLGDFERGRRILEGVLASYEAAGEAASAGYARNTLAFALFRSGRMDDAIGLEEFTLRLMKDSAKPDRFLLTILQLNLGRLYRNVGISDRALCLFKKAVSASDSELSPYLLLLFHSTLGHLHFARKEYAWAFAALHHALQLARDLQLDGVTNQMMVSLRGNVPALPLDQALRGDQVFYYLHANLILTCKMLGQKRWVDAAQAYLHKSRKVLGDQAILRFKKALDEATEDRPASDSGKADFGREVEDSIAHYSQLIRASNSGDCVSHVVEALIQGRVVGFVAPREVAGDVSCVSSLVIYDPRRSELARRVNREVGGTFIDQAVAGLMIPPALPLFREDLIDLPSILQRGSLKREERFRLPALNSSRACLQMLWKEPDDTLFEIVDGFWKKTGIGVLATAPFYLRRFDLAVTPDQALHAFLAASSVDCLLLADRLIDKIHGADATENLMPFRPKRSQQAFLLDFQTRGDEKGGTFVIRIKRRGGYATDSFLKLRSELRPIVDLCDGRMTVGEIAGKVMSKDRLGVPEGKIVNFLRTLSQYGALRFESPKLERETELR